MSRLRIIVPMAGKGSRFQAIADEKPEYRVPKPLILVKDKPMMWWALSSLANVSLPGREVLSSDAVKAEDIVCIIQKEHQTNFKMADEIKKYFGNVTIVQIPEVTRGAAETVLQAEQHLDLFDQVILLDSDTLFEGKPLLEAIKNKPDDIAGIIPVFKPPTTEPRYSYTLFDKNNHALAVGEKDAALAAKGAYANLGAYYFSQWKIFADLTKAMIEKNEKYGPEGKQEFYIAPLYQKILDKGMKVDVAIIEKMTHLGTPQELEQFLTS